jgi:hypothetical protein
LPGLDVVVFVLVVVILVVFVRIVVILVVFVRIVEFVGGKEVRHGTQEDGSATGLALVSNWVAYVDQKWRPHFGHTQN